MEIRPQEKTHHVIYCEKHTPLKLRRILENKEKKYKEEIFKFYRSIEKYYDTYTKDIESVPQSKSDKININKIISSQISKEMKISEENQFLSALQHTLKKRQEFQFIINLEKVYDH